MKKTHSFILLLLLPLFLASCYDKHRPTGVFQHLIICTEGAEFTITYDDYVNNAFVVKKQVAEGSYTDTGYEFISAFSLFGEYDHSHDNIYIQRTAGDNPLHVLTRAGLYINGEWYGWSWDEMKEHGLNYSAMQLVDSVRSQCPQFYICITDNEPHVITREQLYGSPYPSITIN